MLKSNRKVFTLPVQRKQTPYASCPVIRKRISLGNYIIYNMTENINNFLIHQHIFTII